MSEPLLPDLADPLTAPFWAAAREGRLVVQRCLSCGELRYPPLSGCPDCLSREAKWEEMSGHGVVWSFAVYHRALNAAFVGQVPYTIAVVELDEGPRVTARMVASDRPLTVGTEVTAVFEEITPEVTAPRWRPVMTSDERKGHRH